MLHESTFHGGAAHTTSVDVTLHMNSPRVLAVNGASPGAITLPRADKHTVHPRHLGGPRFIIVALSGSNDYEVRQPNISGSGHTVLATVSGGGVCVVDLVDAEANEWITASRALNTPRAYGAGTVSMPAEEAAETLPDPFCFVGDDCEYASPTPLDGKMYRPLVVIPMYQEVCRLAQNAGREPIRAADIVMPNRIVVRFEPDEFVPDPAHPLAATVLSQQFYDALYQGGNPHLLEYLGNAHGTSRNPYHTRAVVAGGVFAWSHPSGGMPVKRHLWERQISYEVDEVEYLLRIVFHVEHSVDPEPDGEGGGGEGDPDDGMYGTLAMVYVFAEELLPSWDDGDSHQAAGFTEENVFSRSDPFIWGSASGVGGGGDDDKGCHPHLVIAAALKTTWHDPCLYEWVPHLDRRYVMQLHGGNERAYNREAFYKLPNCSPWVPDRDRDETFCRDCFAGGAGSTVGVFGTSHFGRTVGGTNAGAMTFGGDVPKSAITDHVCIENGLATGRTYLIPERPGWDEEIGRPTEGGASMSVAICLGVTGDDDDWPAFEVDSCEGHPAEPFEGIGGSHRCFKTTDDTDTRCCITLVDDDAIAWHDSIDTPMQSTITLPRPISQSAGGSAIDYCIQEWVQYGPRMGGSCIISAFGCKVIGTTRADRVMLLYDYDYVMGGNQDNRRLTYRRYLPLPDQNLAHYSFDPSEVDDLVEEIGTFVVTTNILVGAANPTVEVTALLLYKPDGVTYRDAVVSATARRATEVSHALAVNASVNGSDESTGYFVHVAPTGSGVGVAQILFIDDDVVTVLAEKNIILDDDNVDLLVDKWGHEIRFSWQVDGQEADELTAYNCQISDGGHPGAGMIGPPGGVTLAEFDDFMVVDHSTVFDHLEGYLGPETVSFTFPYELRPTEGRCNEEYNVGCGSCCEPERCNCLYWNNSLRQVESATWSGPGDLSGLPAPTDPTFCNGPLHDTTCDTSWCNGVDPRCGQCPPPFPALTFCLPYRCKPASWPSEPNICTGLTKWHYVSVVCD